MSKRCIADECLSSTGFSYTLSLINGKYKMTILYTLMEFGVVRFNEMKKYIGEISYKNVELHAERAGGRPACPPGGIPADSAQSGIQPHGAWKIPYSYFGRNVRMGRQESPLSYLCFFQSKSLSLLSASHLASSASLFSYSLRISLAESLPRANLWGHCPLFISFTSTSPALSGFPGWS